MGFLYARPAAMLSAFLFALLCSGAARAAPVIFDGGGNGSDWSDGANWDTASPPSAADTATVNTAGTRVDTDLQIQSFDLGTGGGAIVESGSNLTISGNSSNAGTFNLASASSSSTSAATLDINGTGIRIDGDGQILFGSTTFNRLRGVNTTDTLILGSDQTLATELAGHRGFVDLELSNEGLIRSDGQITFNENLTNTGTLRATIGGSLVAAANTLIDNTGGLIDLNAGSNLEANSGVEIRGGTIQGPGSIDLTGTSLTLRDVSLNGVETNLSVNDDLTLTGSVNHSGTIRLQDTSSSTTNQARVILDGTSLSGTGVIEFASGFQNELASTNGPVTLTAGQTVRTSGAGSRGQIEADLINEGTIRTDAGVITLNTLNKVNNALIEAVNGGNLEITSITVDNTHGTIRAASGSSLDVNSNTTVDGGTIELLDGALWSIDNNVVIQNAQISGSGTGTVNGSVEMLNTVLGGQTLLIGASDTLTLSGTLGSDSSVSLQDLSSSTTNAARLRIDTSTVVDGDVTFDSIYQNYIESQGGPVTFNAGQTIRATGSGNRGEIRADAILEGTVQADAGTVVLNVNDKTNSGTIEALNGGNLQITAINVNNAGGTIRAATGGSLDVNSNTSINGGSLELQDGALWSADNNVIVQNAQISGSGTGTINGNVQILNSNIGGQSLLVGASDLLTISGTLAADSSVSLNDLGSSTSTIARLLIDPSTTVDGDVTFDSIYQNHIESQGGTVTFNAGQTIRTTGTSRRGELRADAILNGTVQADAGTIVLNVDDKTNNGTIEAINGGNLQITAITIDNTNGTIRAATAGSLDVNSNSSISGGNIELHDGALWSVDNNSVIQNAQITGLGTGTINGNVQILNSSISGQLMQVGASDVLTISGALAADSSVSLNDLGSSTSNSARLLIDASTTVDGDVTFDSIYQNQIESVGGAVTFNAGQTIRTTGTGRRGVIRAEANLGGTVRADAGTIVLELNDKTNQGVIEAINGGAVHVNAIRINNQTGVFNLDNGSLIVGSDTTITGGQINTSNGGNWSAANRTQFAGVTFLGQGSGTISGASTFEDVSLGGQAITLGASDSISVVNQLSLTDSVVSLADTSNSLSNTAELRAVGQATVSGSGTIEFASAAQNELTGDDALASLTFGPDVLLRVNAGANGRIETNVFTEGTLQVDGTLTSNTNVTSSGLLTGSGTINLSNFDLLNEGVLSATTGGIGVLTFVDANVVNSASSSLSVDIGGAGGTANAGITSDLIDVDGSFLIAGFLEVLLDGFVPDFGTDEYTIVTATSGFVGTVNDFLNVTQGTVFGTFGSAAIRIDNGTDLILFNISNAAVDEPGAISLGLFALLLLRRRIAIRPQRATSCAVR